MRKFTKYPSNYVKATAYYVSKTQMDDWKQIARAYAKKVGAELLFVNENSFGIEYPDGTMQHIRIEDLADLLGAGDIEACGDIKASSNYKLSDKKLVFSDGDSYEFRYTSEEGDVFEPKSGSGNWWTSYIVTPDNKLLSWEFSGRYTPVDAIYGEDFWIEDNSVEACGSVECSTDIKASNNNYTWDRNRFDTIIGKILEYWKSMEKDTCTSKEIYDYLAQFGITNIDPDEFSKAWDRAVAISGPYFELADSPVTLSNGLEISNKEEAYTWLRENVEQYGNTYFWDSSLKSDLDKLVERFGNTYFWRS